MFNLITSNSRKSDKMLKNSIDQILNVSNTLVDVSLGRNHDALKSQIINHTNLVTNRSSSLITIFVRVNFAMRTLSPQWILFNLQCSKMKMSNHIRSKNRSSLNKINIRAYNRDNHDLHTDHLRNIRMTLAT